MVNSKKINLLSKSLINLDKKFYFENLLKITEKKIKFTNFEKIKVFKLWI